MIDYRNMTLSDLFDEARKKDIPRYATMLRYDLIRQLENIDTQRKLSNLHKKAEGLGVRGYSIMDEAQLQRAIEKKTLAQEKIKEEMMQQQGELQEMAARKKPVRKTTNKKLTRKTAAKKPVKKAAPKKTVTRKKNSSRKNNNTVTAGDIAAQIFDYTEFGRQTAKEVLKIKGLTIPMANQYCREITRKQQITGARREAFNQGWLEVMQRYLVQ